MLLDVDMRTHSIICYCQPLIPMCCPLKKNMGHRFKSLLHTRRVEGILVHTVVERDAAQGIPFTNKEGFIFYETPLF